MSLVEQKLSGTTKDAKGRNGHFQPITAEINRWSYPDPDKSDTITLSIWSKRTDGNPPIWLHLEAPEMARLGQWIFDNARGRKCQQ